ncbi:MAG: DUF748 domain-containing protein [Acidobacteriota bacterium]
MALTTRARRWLVATVAAVALYASLGFLVVPPVVQSQIVTRSRNTLHREARVERVTFNPFTLAATVSGLDLRDRDGAPLFAFDRLTVDLEVAGLLKLAWRLREFRLDRPVIHARILTDGRPSIADLFEEKRPVRPGGEKRGLPRVIVDHLVVGGGRVLFEDASRSPAYSTSFEPLGADVRELTTIPGKSGDHAIAVRLEGGAEIRWTGHQTVDPLRLEGRLEIDSIRLRTVWELAGLDVPLDIPYGTADLGLSYLVERREDRTFRASLGDGTVTVTNLAVHSRGGESPWARVERLEATGVAVAWPERRLTVEGVRCTRPEASARFAEDLTLDWAALLGTLRGGRSPASGEVAAQPPWSAAIGALVVEGGVAHLEDRSVVPAVALEVSSIAARLEGLSTDAAAPIAVEASARLLGAGSASVKGTVIAAGPVADLEISSNDLDLTPLQPYLEGTVPARVVAGVAGALGRITMRPAPQGLGFEGAAWLKAPDLHDLSGNSLLGCRSVRADGIRITTAPIRVRVTRAVVDGGFATVRIDREKSLNLARFLARVAITDQSSPALRYLFRSPIPMYLGELRFRDTEADFADESLILPFAARIHGLTGTVTDVATVGAAPARVALEGRVDETGFVSAVGTLRIGDPFAATELRVVFRSLNMNRLTPYSAEFAGYSIERGRLDLDALYRLDDRRLIGEHRVVAHDMTLGGKVEGSKVGLPIRMAVALLKDEDGRIDLDVPVEGSVDSPEFAYRKVMWQAVRTILGNIVKAPFRALGRLFGRDEEDLELVGFEPGRSALIPPERDKLAQIGAGIAGRPDLVIEVEGRFDPEADAQVLRADALESRIAERRVAKADAVAAEVGVLDTILEEVFAETFSPEALVEERARFTATPPTTPPERPERRKRRETKRRAAEAPPPASGTFDAEGFYDALRARLLAAQPIGAADLTALADSRAQAVSAAILAGGQIDPTRVTTRGAAPAARRKRAATGLVASELTLTAPQ